MLSICVSLKLLWFEKVLTHFKTISSFNQPQRAFKNIETLFEKETVLVTSLFSFSIVFLPFDVKSHHPSCNCRYKILSNFLKTLLKTLFERKKILVTSIFHFSLCFLLRQLLSFESHATALSTEDVESLLSVNPFLNDKF